MAVTIGNKEPNTKKENSTKKEQIKKTKPKSKS